MLRILKIIVKNSGKIFLEINRAEASRAANGIVAKNIRVTSDLQPHKDFRNALERMTPHLLIACGLAEPEYGLIDKKFPIDQEWFDKWEWKDDPRFQGVTVTGVHVIGKDSPDGIKLLGTKETPQGGVTALKTPLISLLKNADGWNYPLLDLIDVQFDTLLTEAQEYHTDLKHAPDPQLEMFEDKSMRVA